MILETFPFVFSSLLDEVTVAVPQLSEAVSVICAGTASPSSIVIFCGSGRVKTGAVLSTTFISCVCVRD